jgi:two-component system chemotaxis response regulator CheB
MNSEGALGSDEKISVLIVDDSALVRKILSDMISGEPGMEVAGFARNGNEAIKRTLELDPDVVTMDIYMPDMDGLSALEFIMKRYPRPVVMISAFARKGAEPTLKALELGAVDFIEDLSRLPDSMDNVREDVIRKIRAAAYSRAKEVWMRSLKVKSPRKVKLRKDLVRGGRVVVMGASAGGPKALAEVIPALPEGLPATIAIVQHMPEKITEFFAERLNSKSRIEVSVANQGEELSEGKAYVVPGGKDMGFEVRTGGNIGVTLMPTLASHGASPVIDVTMESAAQVFHERAIGVLLSGMGSDGAMGLGMIKDAGGDTIAQNEETSLVFSMPRIAIEREFVGEVLPVESIAEAIVARL